MLVFDIFINDPYNEIPYIHKYRIDDGTLVTYRCSIETQESEARQQLKKILTSLGYEGDIVKGEWYAKQ
jgi:hypothetical protein